MPSPKDEGDGEIASRLLAQEKNNDGKWIKGKDNINICVKCLCYPS